MKIYSTIEPFNTTEQQIFKFLKITFSNYDFTFYIQNGIIPLICKFRFIMKHKKR